MAKIYHRAKKMNAKGEVSALCYTKPRAIDLSKEAWTLRDQDATCKKCLKIIADRPAP